MKIFPAVHYSMGGLWVDYERTDDGGLVPGSPRNQLTNIPGLYAIGECDYQYHGANRLGANSLLSCIFTGLFVAPGIVNLIKSGELGAASDQPASLYEGAEPPSRGSTINLLNRRGGDENPYLMHQQLGDVMTVPPPWCATMISWTRPTRRCANCKSVPRIARLRDTGNWTNQNVVFTKALLDMFPLAKHDSEGRSSTRRMSWSPLQAGVSDARCRIRRSRGAPSPGGRVVRSVRGEQPEVAQDDRRQARRGW